MTPKQAFAEYLNTRYKGRILNTEKPRLQAVLQTFKDHSSNPNKEGKYPNKYLSLRQHFTLQEIVLEKLCDIAIIMRESLYHIKAIFYQENK